MDTRVTVNGVTIESDMGVRSIINSTVYFTDGSSYDVESGELKGRIRGYIMIDGRTLGGSRGTSGDPAKTEIVTRKLVFDATEVSLDLVSNDVTVIGHDGGMRAELKGPAYAIDSIKTEERNGALHLTEEPSGRSGGDMVIGNGNSVSNIFGGGSISISGITIRSNSGNVTVNSGSSNRVSIVIYVPYGTPIGILSRSADVDIENVNGPLYIRIQGSADITASDASGAVQIAIAGSGDVDINGGTVDSFDVSIAGSGDVKFRGTATEANLSIAGSGDISVERVLTQPMKQVAGSGDIRIKRVG